MSWGLGSRVEGTQRENKRHRHTERGRERDTGDEGVRETETQTH